MCRPKRLPGKPTENGRPEVTLARDEPMMTGTVASFIGLIRVFLLVKSAVLKHFMHDFYSVHISLPLLVR